ncbi:MAG: hypothetical protein RBG13Loki_1970 [Promethearchaeota archaeon CR_4]|nr:MAG: hypothetical protein RBG13Loki_1970 [Candidatus Lokiarchaeota archaeon CR_4]
MQKLVSCRCSKCSQDITFVVPEDEIRRGTFPIMLQKLHGTPPHKLLIMITHNFQVKPVGVEDITPMNAPASQNYDELFAKIGLTPAERELYFLSLKRQPISVNDFAKIGCITPRDAQIVAEKLVEKGFFKEIDDNGHNFQPLPPYAVILSEFENILRFIRNIELDLLKELDQSFVAFKHQTEELRDVKQFSELLNGIAASVSAMINAVLSQVFAKFDHGSILVGQLWDQATKMKEVLAKFTEISSEDTSQSESPTPSMILSSSSQSSIELLPTPKTKRPPPPRIHLPPNPAPTGDMQNTPQKTKLYAIIGELEKKINEFATGNECAEFVLQLRDRIQKEYGFYPIFNDMTNWGNQLRHGFKWDAQGKDFFHKRVILWREKLME